MHQYRRILTLKSIGFPFSATFGCLGHARRIGFSVRSVATQCRNAGHSGLTSHLTGSLRRESGEDSFGEWLFLSVGSPGIRVEETSSLNIFAEYLLSRCSANVVDLLSFGWGQPSCGVSSGSGVEGVETTRFRSKRLHRQRLPIALSTDMLAFCFAYAGFEAGCVGCSVTVRRL